MEPPRNGFARNHNDFREGTYILRHHEEAKVPQHNSTTTTTTTTQHHHTTNDPCLQEYNVWISERTPGLTKEDMLRSRTYIGNRYRLARLANKLGMAKRENDEYEGRKDFNKSGVDEERDSNSNGDNNNSTKQGIAPIHAVVCGGSISLGHGVKTSYSNQLQNWINRRFPVSDTEKQHKVVNKGMHGADICAMAKRTNKFIKELGPNIDLFILEFAVNDYQGQDHVTQVDDKMDTFFEGFRDIASCTESVLVKLLQHYPDAAIVFLEMRTAVIPRKNAAVLHMGAAQHYQVPVISYEQALWPDYMQLLEALQPHGYTAAINDTILPFPHGCHGCDLEGMEDDDMRRDGCQSVCDFQRTSGVDFEKLDCDHAPPGRQPCYVSFLAHDEVHPSGIGHKIASDLIIDALATTRLDLCYQQQEREELWNRNTTKNLPKTILEKKATFPMVGWMANNPLIMDAQTNFILVNDTYQMFTEVDKLVPSSHTNGFRFLEDRFERSGWIATNEAGNESIIFEIDLPTVVPNSTNKQNNNITNNTTIQNQIGCYIPYLSVLKSYENMGKMAVTVHDRIKDLKFVMEIDSLWEPRISVPNDFQLIARNELWYEVEDGCSGNCSITVTSNPIVEGRGGNKIKILTLSVRPCIRRELLEHETF